MECSAMRLMKFEQGLTFDKLIGAMLQGEDISGPGDAQTSMGKEDPSDDQFTAVELTGFKGLLAFTSLEKAVQTFA